MKYFNALEWRISAQSVGVASYIKMSYLFYVRNLKNLTRLETLYLLDSTTDLEEHQRMFNLNDLEFFYCQFTLLILVLKISNWKVLTFNQVRFVDSILSNNSTDDHCREFVRLGGLEPLINILGLPNLPLDFVSSQACQSVSGVCKSILVSICILDTHS